MRRMYLTVLAFELALTVCLPARAWAQEPSKPAARPYTIEEYNAQAAPLHVSDPRQKIALLDAFVSKYPNSELRVFIDLQYCDAYKHLGDLLQVMKYAERVLSSKTEKTKVDINDRFETAVAWAEAYNKLRSTDLALAAKARTLVDLGFELIAEIERENAPRRETFPEELRRAKLYLNITAASAAMTMKDYEAASDSLAAVVALSVYDPSELRPLSVSF